MFAIAKGRMDTGFGSSALDVDDFSKGSVGCDRCGWIVC